MKTFCGLILLNSGGNTPNNLLTFDPSDNEKQEHKKKIRAQKYPDIKEKFNGQLPSANVDFEM